MSEDGTLKSRSGKIRYVTISDNNPDHFASLIEHCSMYDFWAYVFHMPESEDSKPHIHILCMSHNPMKISTHAEKWSDVIAPNFVCAVGSPKKMARYLLHLDNPEKIQYQVSDVHTNSLDHYSSLINNSFKPDSLEMWDDYVRLRTRKMSPKEFLDKYRSEISQLGIYQRMGIFSKIFDCSPIYPEDAYGNSISSFNS